MFLSKRYFNYTFRYKVDIFLFFFLLGLGIKYVFNIENFTDIQLYDESSYLYQGIHLTYLGLPSAQSAPIYSLWYYILSFFEQDSVNLYFLNYQIATVILPVLLFLVLRKHRVPRLQSFLITYFLLISSGNILVWPKVSHFAISLILISIIISSFLKNSFYRFVVIIIGALLSAYIRPELFISFIFFLLAYLYKTIKNNSFIREIRATSILGIVIIINFIVFGIPLANDSRSFAAFSQHFSINWIKWNDSQLSPWTNADEIINKSFGKVNNIYEAMISNSNLFFNHISINIRSFGEEFNNLINHTVFFPSSYKYRNMEFIIIAFFTLLYTLYKIYIKNDKIIHYIRDNLKQRKEIILICIGYIIPEALSVIIIYPRAHYLIILLITVILLIMILLYYPIKGNNNQIGILKYSFLIIISALLIIITPHSSNFFTFDSHNNIATIKYLRSLKIKSKVNILEADGGYNIYLGLNYERIPEYSKDSKFDDFLLRKNINMIVLNGKLTSYNKFNSDSTWLNFISNFEMYDFYQEIIPNSGSALLIKNNLR